MTALLSPASPEESLALASGLLLELRPLLLAPSADSTRVFLDAHSRMRNISPDHACLPAVECLLAIAQYYYMAAQPVLALPPASQAVELSRRLSDAQLLRKALTFLGVMRMETGNLPGATESYSEALEIARSLDDPGAEAPVWNNLGLALQNSAQYSDALQCFERAAR